MNYSLQLNTIIDIHLSPTHATFTLSSPTPVDVCLFQDSNCQTDNAYPGNRADNNLPDNNLPREECYRRGDSDQISLKDLCSKDKKRIADLIRELAKFDVVLYIYIYICIVMYMYCFAVYIIVYIDIDARYIVKRMSDYVQCSLIMY